MTDNEIIKAWEILLYIGDAPIGEHWHCSVSTLLAKETFEMLKRLQEQNAALIAGQETLQKCIAEKDKEIEKLTVNKNAFGLGMVREKERADKAKAEAIKEFAERLKRQFKIQPHYQKTTMIVCDCVKETIDNLVKEMAGEQQ